MYPAYLSNLGIKFFVATINIGVVGAGYWGPNYLRIFSELEGGRCRCCCDLDEANLRKVKKAWPSTIVTKDYEEVAKDPDVDGVVITTPLDTHYEVARCCLEEGKHVLIEKPFTSTSKEAEKLIEMADKNNLVLMAGHVYRYNPGIVKLKEIMGELGDVYYASAERVGLGPIRKRANVLWDLVIHDISISTYLFDTAPKTVSTEGASYIQEGVEDVVFLNLKFPNNVIFTVYATWIAPEKIRKVTVVGSKAMAVFDDVRKSEMLKVYEREVDKTLLDSTPEYCNHQSIVALGDIYLPRVDQSEPLKNQASHFLDCISKNKRPITDGYEGLKVIRILESAQKSLGGGGREVCL